MIENVRDLCEALEDFYTMMQSDFRIEKERSERMGDIKAVAKMILLSNMLDEFSDIAEFAKRYNENMED